MLGEIRKVPRKDKENENGDMRNESRWMNVLSEDKREKSRINIKIN